MDNEEKKKAARERSFSRFDDDNLRFECIITNKKVSEILASLAISSSPAKAAALRVVEEKVKPISQHHEKFGRKVVPCW